MDIQEKIKEVIENMTEGEKISLWDNYCNEDSRMDDYIYSMEEFDEIFSGSLPWEVVRTCYYSGNFCPAHDFFWFNGYGNAESSDFPSLDGNSPFYIDEIVSYIVDNENSLYNDDIQVALDEREDQEEDGNE